jgi:hypothetical protein
MTPELPLPALPPALVSVTKPWAAPLSQLSFENVLSGGAI